MIQRSVLVIFFLSLLASCIKPPTYDPIPQIAFDSISKTLVKGLSSTPPALDSITFQISFTDGDGDLGASSSDTASNLFFRDSRTGFVNRFQFPYITPEGNVKDISGTIAYIFSPFDCDPGGKSDTFHYTIFIKDRAGNLSNEVITPTIICDCN